MYVIENRNASYIILKKKTLNDFIFALLESLLSWDYLQTGSTIHTAHTQLYQQVRIMVLCFISIYLKGHCPVSSCTETSDQENQHLKHRKLTDSWL